jgi:hypothetical protein
MYTVAFLSNREAHILYRGGDFDVMLTQVPIHVIRFSEAKLENAQPHFFSF